MTRDNDYESDYSQPLLSIGEIAQLMRVSQRMLRHWEAAGLISPMRSQSGYRQYSEEDIAHLERVLIYRKMGFNAQQIKALLNSKTPLALEELRGQRSHMKKKIHLLEETVCCLDRLVAIAEVKPQDGQAMTIIKEADQQLYEAQERWGASQQWLEYAERKASRTSEQQKQDMDHLEKVETKLGQAKRNGLDPTGDKAFELIEEHRQALAWFHVTPSMHLMLGRMYVADQRFNRHYEQFEPGLAEWMLTAIESAARAHGVDPATAQWE
ncbi:MerR family transcriptional regulator [Bombiscardovia coagulans]|uniref:MerR family transcriptional regulator n=1 Tax=Bombiscardovia coagulans TaxID=686666 RepID=A0A261ETG2_9BIFI|nr:TipAS antibiotic-recognition domain-containing protein [Bombiscardovia coagulans]OZG50149.1 MerR family transcriptional regulator [Bombiscardovia coagulans]